MKKRKRKVLRLLDALEQTQVARDVVWLQKPKLKSGNVFIIQPLEMVWIEMETVRKNIDVKQWKRVVEDVTIKQRIRIKSVMLINKCVIII